ncbi:unnamed protein product [Schistosoma mattheei]|uniref:Uncharacterized protein n=1 Tax=Schistosoma mattheei TaxID=31246 RepID=A0A183P669_9TREM|nr:unnamed protein product [Schistosoma mattheei]
MKNSCKRPGCRFAVTTGMECDNCKVRFHGACTDLTATAYSRLSKSDHKWEFVTCRTDSVALLSNIIVLLTGLQSKLSANLGKDSQKMGRQTRERIENENRDVHRSTNAGAGNSINDDTLKLSTMITMTVLDSLSKLGSHSSRFLNTAAVPKNSVGDSTHVKRAEKDQASQSKLNIPYVERKSTGDLVAQSTPKNVRPVIKEPEIQKRALTSKQQGIKPEPTGNLLNQQQFVTILP